MQFRFPKYTDEVVDIPLAPFAAAEVVIALYRKRLVDYSVPSDMDVLEIEVGSGKVLGDHEMAIYFTEKDGNDIYVKHETQGSTRVLVYDFGDVLPSTMQSDAAVSEALDAVIAKLSVQEG